MCERHVLEEWVFPLFCFVNQFVRACYPLGMNTLREKIEHLAQRVAREEDVELYDIELLGKGKLVVRVYIDTARGVTLDECEKFSKHLSVLLDVENPIPGPYTLEVSSPGLNRRLRNLTDYEEHVGKLARVVTREKIDNRTFFIGRIRGVREGAVILVVDGIERTIPYEQIVRGNLEIEL